MKLLFQIFYCLTQWFSPVFDLPVNVTLWNSGNVLETASVQLFANSTLIYTGILNLDSLSSGILNCSIDTSSLPIGNYSITASVTPSDQPTATSSDMSAGMVGLTYLGDLNGDFKVDGSDFLAFMSDYVTYWTTGYANPASDYNHSGIIDSSAFFDFMDYYIAYWSPGGH